MLRDLYGRAEIEQVLSGPGLVNIYRFTHAGGSCDATTGVSADGDARRDLRGRAVGALLEMRGSARDVC